MRADGTVLRIFEKKYFTPGTGQSDGQLLKLLPQRRPSFAPIHY
ncbi:hypothetical protein ACFS07_08885 [Undibacterium arcticum]